MVIYMNILKKPLFFLGLVLFFCADTYAMERRIEVNSNNMLELMKRAVVKEDTEKIRYLIKNAPCSPIRLVGFAMRLANGYKKRSVAAFIRETYPEELKDAQSNEVVERIRCGDLEYVKYAIENCGYPLDEPLGRWGTDGTPLSIAAFHNQNEVICYLIMHGAKAEKRSDQHYGSSSTPLYWVLQDKKPLREGYFSSYHYVSTPQQDLATARVLLSIIPPELAKKIAAHRGIIGELFGIRRMEGLSKDIKQILRRHILAPLTELFNEHMEYVNYLLNLAEIDALRIIEEESDRIIEGGPGAVDYCKFQIEDSNGALEKIAILRSPESWKWIRHAVRKNMWRILFNEDQCAKPEESARPKELEKVEEEKPKSKCVIQ